MVLIAIVLGACGASQPVRVLPATSTAITASVGGPVVPASSPTGVVPYISAGAAHGLSDEVTIHGNLHLIMAAFAVAGADVGASMRLVREDGPLPELTGALRLIGFVDVAGPAAPRLYPDAALTASWTLTGRTLLYVGSHGTYQAEPSAFFVSPFLGLSFPVSEHVTLQAEAIWQAANADTHSGIFEGASSIGGMGSFGIFVAGVLTL
jgi:hypothetical protein